MKKQHIDYGQPFDFGKTSQDYAGYRDIYPPSLFNKLQLFGIGQKGQRILDVGTGTGVIPRAMANTGALFNGTDISPQQIEQAEQLSQGLGIQYKVAPAEQTGLPAHSFDVVIACQCFHYFDEPAMAQELKRLLVPGGRFCKIMMYWLPYEDKVAEQMEQLVLQYNPSWTGGHFKEYHYTFPHWAEKAFELETVHSYNERLLFTKEAWRGRIRSCRGVGASLSPEAVEQFDREYAAVLEKLSQKELSILHQIQIEIYRLKPSA